MAEPEDPSDYPTVPELPEPPRTLGRELNAGDLFAAAAKPARSGGVPAWQAPTEQALQRELPQYEILALVGRGGMGAVYRGHQRSLDRQVAIKILPAEFASSDPEYVARFQREARAMARLSHPGIVAVHDAGETAGGLLYFIMDYVEGTDVHQMVAAQGRLAEPDALAIAVSVCEALAYAHARGIIHRDIKPSNVMVDTDGGVKVADFGLAKIATAESALFTASNVAMGTPDFMAPESLLGTAHVDHRADLYAVGVMLYQMLTGKLPRGRFVAPSRAVSGVDRRLDRILDRALQPDPTTRFQSAAEFKSSLDPICTRALAKRESDASAVASRRGRLSLVAVILVALLGAGWLGWKSHAGQLSPASSSIGKASPSPGAVLPTPLGELRERDSARTTPAAASTATIESRAIKLWDAPEKIDPANGISWEDSALRLHQANQRSGPTSLNAIVRFSVRMNPDAGGPGVALRHTDSATGQQCRLSLADGKLSLRTARVNGEVLGAWPLHRAYRADEWMRLELRALGDRFSVWVDGELLGAVSSHAMPEAGDLLIFGGSHCFFRDIVYLPLDGLPEAEALKLAGISTAFYPQPAQWIDATEEVRAAALRDGKARSDGEWLEATAPNGSSGFGGRSPRSDVVVKAIFTHRVGVNLRHSDGGAGYLASLSKRGARLELLGSGGESVLANVELGQNLFEGDAPHEAVFAAQGSQLRLWLDGQLVANATDTHLTSGKLELTTVADGKAPPSRIKKVEYGDLPATSGQKP